MYLPTAETLVIESDEVGDRLDVVVARPADSGADVPLSVVYALDPAFTFATVVAAASWLRTASQLAGGDIPPLLVVGVGYPSADLGEIIARRARDLTPTDGGAPANVRLPVPPFGFGGAARFLDALEQEVMPEVEARYDVDSVDRTLLGFSFGGLFALYTLFHRPQTFGRYLVVSSSIWWDDRVVLRYEEAWAADHEDLPARVFLSVGREEQSPGGGWKNEGFPDEALAALRQVENVRELCNRLRSRRYAGLRLDCAFLEGEHHLTGTAAAVTRGLVALYSAHEREDAVSLLQTTTPRTTPGRA